MSNNTASLINTKKVTGRRTLRYESLDQFLADAERIAASEVKLLGNWSQGQIFVHLAKTMNSSIDGFDFSMPAPVRFVLSLMMKKKFLYKSIPAGFKPKGLNIPDLVATESGLADLKEAIKRQTGEAKRADHPGFGKISNEEWNQFHLRHAELHMSFIV